MATQKLLDLLRKKEWLLRDKLERADATNKVLATVPVFTQEQMVQMELDMLDAQIELEREESALADKTRL